MNQNVLNSSWFKSLGSEIAAADRSQSNIKPRATGESSFQNYLNSQMHRAELTEKTRQTEFSPKEVKVKKEGVKSILKTVDTTASKLAVKSPDKPVERPVQAVESSTPEKVSEPVAENETIETEVKETKQTETVMTEVVSEEPTVSSENLMALLQQLLTQLQATATTPETEDSKLGELKTQLEALVNQLVQGQQNNQPIDPQLLQKVQKTLDGIMTLDGSFKPEVLETLQSLIKEMQPQAKTEQAKVQEFGKVLENAETESKVGNEVPKAQTPEKSSDAEQSTVGEPAAKATAQTATKDINADNTAKAAFGNLGKEKLESKVEVTESKSGQTQTNVSLSEVNAKMTSASIAFGKTEVANQTTKSVLQQNIMDQLINSPKMQIRQTEQGTMMTMKLNPEVLGNVEIKMEIVKGVLQAEINVENMIVKGAIEANLSDLKNALSDKGYQVESLNVSVGKDSQDSRGQQQQQQAERNDRNTEEVDMTSGSYGFESLVNDTQIDYRG